MRNKLTFFAISMMAVCTIGCTSAREVRLARRLADVQASMAQREEMFYNEPSGPRRIDMTSFDEGVAMAKNLQFDRAAGRFATLVNMFEASGEDNRAAEALFWLAYCREKQNRTREAALLYQRVLRKYADSPASREADRRLGALSHP